MQIAADELLVELDRTDAMMRDVERCAGQGCSHDFERRFEAQLRRLRSMLGTDGMQAAADTMEAAERVLTSADPAAPLLMLSLSRRTLAAVMRREADGMRLRAA
ncbi:MAG: hypothetical protein M3Q96_01385 [Pseudomonadota bacterium]|nr:hypothetical protein [Pseudomonadota bacterium]MDQ3229192.1 hypothetical protein [Pseudomonadota bacterium]